MPDATELAQRFFDALAARDETALLALLTEDAGVKLWRWDGLNYARERRRALRLLFDEFGSGDTRAYESFGVSSSGETGTIEFRFQHEGADRTWDHNRAAVIHSCGGLIARIDVYCAAPLPAPRRDWVAPVDIRDAELERKLASRPYAFDLRRIRPMNAAGHLSGTISRYTTGDPHPAGTSIRAIHWSEAEADARIEELIGYQRERGMGFRVVVGPWDTPADLGQRLEAHGLLLAGDQALMMKRGLGDIESIPTNAEIAIERLDGKDEQALEASLQINARAFYWTPEQVELSRSSWYEDIRERPGDITYLARLGGLPVATATIALGGSVAYLGGAATLPEYRSRKIYSTLLKKRLEDARAAGREIVLIHAEPMSRRVVSRYGFVNVGMFFIYGWMPEMDPGVIRALVPDD